MRLIGFLALLIICINPWAVDAQDETIKTENPVFATWAHGSGEFDKELWTNKLKHYSSLGISEVLISGSIAFYNQIIPLAKDYGIRIHAWMWTLNRPGDKIAQQHPEWYSVNRAGQNCFEYRPYVDYYQWLSPFHPEARQHIKNKVLELTKIEGLESIHLDYVRYVDVILGADLQPKYNLVQNREMPEYDFGYHPIARKEFKAIFGKDPIDMKHPELSTEWRQFRLNAVSSLVNEIVDLAHEKGQQVTAAVFPFPEMSRQMVRQAWNDWKLDAAYPMVYHNFYRENINWIGFAVEQGVNSVDFPLFAGLYVPALKDPNDLEAVIKLSLEKGAKGISFFTVDGMEKEQQKVLEEIVKKIADR